MTEDAAQLVVRLRSALCLLPARQRAIFLALTDDGAGYEELSQRFGLSAKDIERDFARALATLAGVLDG